MLPCASNSITGGAAMRSLPRAGSARPAGVVRDIAGRGVNPDVVAAVDEMPPTPPRAHLLRAGASARSIELVREASGAAGSVSAAYPDELKSTAIPTAAAKPVLLTSRSPGLLSVIV